MTDYTLNQFQEQCATTAIYEREIVDLLAPIYDELAYSLDLAHSRYDEYLGKDEAKETEKAIKRLDEVKKILLVSYAVLGLAGEAGEVANKMKKVIRDGTSFEPLNKEVQGAHWYVNACYTELGLKANDSAEQLAATLQSRQERGVLHGNGDNR